MGRGLTGHLMARNVHAGLSQISGLVVGVLHRHSDDAREGSRADIFGGRTTGAFGVFDEMPQRLPGVQQSMHLAGSDQGAHMG